MATFTSYDTIGKAEDVSDIINNISPTDTPFQSMIGKRKVHNDLFQWQEDSLAGVKDNAAIDGADAGAANLSPTVMRRNYTQIIEDVVQVSGRADAIKTYGRARETAYQLMKKGKELKRDLEHALVGRVNNAAVGDATTTPSRMGNVFGTDADSVAMIKASAVIPAGTNGGTPNATTGAVMTEADLLALHLRLFREGSDPKIFMITPEESLTVANFAAASGRERDFGSRTEIVNAVDLYVSPYGELKVVVNRFLQAYLADDADPIEEQDNPTTEPDAGTDADQLGEALLFDPEMFQLATLRPWRRTLLAKTGDSEKHQILGEYSLVHKNYGASGRITDILSTNSASE